jgi:hypothetical protein
MDSEELAAAPLSPSSPTIFLKVYSGKTEELLCSREVDQEVLEDAAARCVPDYRGTEHTPIRIDIEGTPGTIREQIARAGWRLSQQHKALLVLRPVRGRSLLGEYAVLVERGENSYSKWTVVLEEVDGEPCKEERWARYRQIVHKLRTAWSTRHGT